MDTIIVATIRKPHGIKGLVRVKIETDFPSTRFQKGNTLYLRCKDTLKEVTVSHFGGHENAEIIGFEGIRTLEEADVLRGCTLEVSPEEREPLEADAYYFDALIGMHVLYAGEAVGTVKTVMDMPQAAMLRVERPDAKDLLVPFMKHYVHSVNEDQKTINLNEIEGLL